MDKEMLSVSRGSLEVSLWAVTMLQRGLRNVGDRLQHKLGVKHLYKPRPDDIFLVTYPKSGTTLMQMMLYQLTSDGEMNFPHITTVSPWFEQELHRGSGKTLEAIPSPRFFKSHLTYEKLPRNGRYIYVARNVRDVAISAYHHLHLVSGKKPDMEKFVNDFLKEKVGFGSWFEHIESWWPRRNDPNVLFLEYTEVIADLDGTVRQVARFCDIPLEEADLPRIVERCGFAFMKKHDQKFDPRFGQHGPLAFLQGDPESPKFIRKGGSGDGRASFTPEQNRLLSQRMEKLTRKLGRGATDAHPLLRPHLEEVA